MNSIRRRVSAIGIRAIPLRKRIITTLGAMVVATVMLTTTEAHAVLVWVFNQNEAARGSVNKSAPGEVLADDLKADGQSAVTRWRAEDGYGTVFDHDDCVDSTGADNRRRACPLPKGYIFIKICTRNFSNDIGYMNCSDWEGYGWVD
ncbi:MULTISPECIES: hypothetical protein [Streptomyces]|uniref:Secreted protein n=1 Tax=Streptomyces mordarskii TaxID=1226758 RepID=A0ABP3NSP0_9ACTN